MRSAEWSSHFFPQLSIPVGAYALIGMGALFAGILRAPMTSIIMTLEVSGNYSIILPVIVSNTIAYLISRTFQRVPIFDLLSRQDGLDLPLLEEEREVAILRVEDALCPFAEQVLDGKGTLTRALDVIEGAKADFFLVKLPGGRWAGVSRQTLLELEPDGSESLGSRLNMFIPALYPDQSLETALRHISDWPFLPGGASGRSRNADRDYLGAGCDQRLQERRSGRAWRRVAGELEHRFAGISRITARLAPGEFQDHAAALAAGLRAPEAARRIPTTSLGIQQSVAPAASAATHISSSARRWVQITAALR